MADSNTVVAIPGQFTFDGQQVSLNFTSPTASLIGTIDAGGEFPAGDLTLGSLSANATGGSPVTLGTQTKNIAFSFSAGTTYGLQILSNPDDVLKTLNADANISGDIDLKTGTVATDRFLLLRLNYNLGATLKGTAALGAGLTANFGATGQLNGDWDVVHRFGAESAAQVLEDTFSSWRLPIVFSQPSDLKPGTWLVSEISGSINLNLGVQAGYNYSWIKQLADGSLTGDIGLKVALSVTASLGFSANGNYSLVLARPDGSNKVRLSLYKLAKNDFQFALNASAGVQGVLPPALQNITDISGLVKAIFGTQATQLINDLQTVQKVAAGGNLSDQAADFLVSFGEKELGAAADKVTAFNTALGIIQDVNSSLSQLSTLGQKTTGQLLALLPSSANGGAGALADLTTVLTDIKNAAGDPTQITTIIIEQLQKVAFFQTNFGKWMTSVLQDAGQASPLSALNDNTAVQAIGSAASTTLDVLNGTDLQALIDYAATKLDLKNIPTLANIDSWLKSKIAAFLNKALGTVGQQDLDKVQTVVTNLFNKGDALVAEVIKAVQKQYEGTFVATYETTTSNTALIDVTFDFDAGNPNLGSLLHNAINGDFTTILIDPTIVGVTLNSAVLTHGFHRQTHVEFTLPFFDAGATAATDVVDSMTVKHDGGGRILAYTVEGTNDVMSFVKGRSVRDSIMTLAMNLNVPTGVTKAPDFTASFGYSLRAAYAKTTTQQIVTALTPLLSSYNLPLDPSDILTWAIDLDKITEHVPTGQIGTSLMALDVAIDSSLPGVWLKAPGDPKNTAYLILSKRIQERLRSLVGSVYFSQPDAYSDIVTAHKMIIYTSLRSANGFNTDNSNDPPLVGTPTKDVFWDAQDSDQLKALIFDPLTLTAASSKMNDAFQLLSSRGDSDAQFFQNNGVNMNSLVADAEHTNSMSSTMPDLLGNLVQFESAFVSSVVSAATGLAKFVSDAGGEPNGALRQLSSFTAKIVSTFNQGLGSNLVGGDELATVGSALFTEVTIALAQAINATVPKNASPAALFSLSIPQPNANVALDDLKAGNFKPEQILVEQKLSSPLSDLAGTSLVAG